MRTQKCCAVRLNAAMAVRMKVKRSLAFINADVSFRHDPIRVHYYRGIQDGIADEAERRKIPVSFYDQHAPFRDLSRHRDDHGILIGVVKDPAAAWNALARKRPCIGLLYPRGTASENYIGTDPKAAAALIIAHLRGEGYHSIGYAHCSRDQWELERIAAVQALMKKEGVSVNKDWVLGAAEHYHPSGKGKRTELSDLYSRFMSRGDRPQALIFFSDYFAAPFIEFAQRSGIRIPDDIAVAGIDNARNLDIAPDLLTSVDQDFRAMGRMAVTAADEMMRGLRPMRGQRILLTPELIIRRSSRLRTRGDTSAEDRDRIRELITMHYAEPAAAARIAGACDLGQEYFLRKFKHLFNENFTDHVNRIRVAHAAFLLRTTATSVTDIYYAVGFRTYQNFSSFFQRQYGMAPNAYRRRNG